MRRLVGVPAALGAGLAGLGAGIGFGVSRVGEAIAEARGDPLEKAEKELELWERAQKLRARDLEQWRKLLEQQRKALDPAYIPWRMMPGVAPEWFGAPRVSDTGPAKQPGLGFVDKVLIGVAVALTVAWLTGRRAS